MSEKPIIQIDSDWKKEAQEEKRKLAEQQAKSKPASSPAPTAASPDRSPSRQQMPPPSLATLIQTFMTQALYYLGELGDESQQPVLSLDMARHYIDTIAILEDKTKGNLTPDEQSLLDQTLYDLRSRFVGIARQMIQ